MTLVRALLRFGVPVAFAMSLTGCLIGLGSSTVTTTAASTTYKLNFTATLST